MPFSVQHAVLTAIACSLTMVSGVGVAQNIWSDAESTLTGNTPPDATANRSTLTCTAVENIDLYYITTGDDLPRDPCLSYSNGEKVALVEALRLGASFYYTEQTDARVDKDQDGFLDQSADGQSLWQSVTHVKRHSGTQQPIDYGEVILGLSLVYGLKGDQATTGDTLAILFNSSDTGALQLRNLGLGWSQIFAAHSLNFGEVMSKLYSAHRVDPSGKHYGDLPISRLSAVQVALAPATQSVAATEP